MRTTDADLILEHLQQTIADIPDTEKPIAFACSSAALEKLKARFGVRPEKRLVMLSVPIYQLKNPRRFSLDDAHILPIPGRAEMFAIARLDRYEEPMLDTNKTAASAVFEAMRQEYEHTLKGRGMPGTSIEDLDAEIDLFISPFQPC